MKHVKLFEGFLTEGTKDFQEEVYTPGTYKINWNVKDVSNKGGVYIKIFDFELNIEHPGSGWAGKTIKDSVTLAMTNDSAGMFAMGKDVAKFSGLSLKDAQEYN